MLCGADCADCFAAFLVAPAVAQGVPRIKAKILSFDGQTLTVTSGTGKNAQAMTVGVLPTTRIVRQEKRAPADIAVGNNIGATVTTTRDGALHAQEVHIFPEELRGSSEGVFAAGTGRSMIDATVSATAPGKLSVTYRGANGGGRPGLHRPRRPAKSVGGCQGSADILVAPGVPVTALMAGDKSLLVPGALIALSVMAGPDGQPVTPGLTVEGMPRRPAGAAGNQTRQARPPSRPGVRHFFGDSLKKTYL